MVCTLLTNSPCASLTNRNRFLLPPTFHPDLPCSCECLRGCSKRRGFVTWSTQRIHSSFPDISPRARVSGVYLYVQTGRNLALGIWSTWSRSPIFVISLLKKIPQNSFVLMEALPKTRQVDRRLLISVCCIDRPALLERTGCATKNSEVTTCKPGQ